MCNAREIGSTLENLKNIKITKYGDLKIYSGEWRFSKLFSNSPCIYLSVAWSGWGKVSASRAATRLISHKLNKLKIDIILFTGVAGAINPKLKQWDIVITNDLIQHDMDARPLFRKYEIPALRTKKIKGNKKIYNWIFKILKDSKKDEKLEVFGNIYKGLIATGDKFIYKEEFKKISENIKDVFAVEMEGAAVAQVAKQEEIPFQVIRVVSDEANESSCEDFSEFLLKYNNHSAKLISALIENIDSAPI